jgi:hypothetical protein
MPPATPKETVTADNELETLNCRIVAFLGSNNRSSMSTMRLSTQDDWFSNVARYKQSGYPESAVACSERFPRISSQKHPIFISRTQKLMLMKTTSLKKVMGFFLSGLLSSYVLQQLMEKLRAVSCFDI